MVHLFRKTPLPVALPASMERGVKSLRKVRTKEECVKMAYALLSKRVYGYRVKTYTCLPVLFTTNIDKLWNTRIDFPKT